MDNSSYRSQYMKLLSSGEITDQSKDVLLAFWKRVQKTEQEIGKELEAGYSEEEYRTLLEKMNVTNVSVMRIYKSRIKGYIDYLCEQGVLTEQNVLDLIAINYGSINSARVLDLRYYPTLSALQEDIDDCIDHAQRIDENVFAMQISALYLAWYGVRLEELLQIRKSDVHEDSITVGNREIYPTTAVMAYIKDYRDAEGYHSQARQIIYLKYKPSELLFRTPRASEITSIVMLLTSIHVFTKSGGKEKRSLTYDKVYWSGIFHRAYQYELENGAIPMNNLEVRERIFQEHYDSMSEANRRLTEYRQYKEHFFPTQSKRS